MIDASGFKVFPREVEEVLLMHPAVQEAVVAGVPDAYRGETVKAFVVLRPGQEASAEEIADFCRLHLAAFKIPRQVEFRAELPKSIVGKYLRRVLVEEERARQALRGAVGPAGRAEAVPGRPSRAPPGPTAEAKLPPAPLRGEPGGARDRDLPGTAGEGYGNRGADAQTDESPDLSHGATAGTGAVRMVRVLADGRASTAWGVPPRRGSSG